MELDSKIRQSSGAQALIIAIVDTNGPEFRHYLSAMSADEYNLKPRQKEAILTEIGYRSVLSQFGVSPDCQRFHSQMGEPIWPNGIVGSVTHKKETAIIAIAKDTDYQSLGIDLEYFNPLHKLHIQDRILNDAERKLFEGQKSFQFDLLLLFSAKESIYKAVYPLTKQFFGFKDVECLSKTESNLTFVLKRKLGLNFEEGTKINVNYLTAGEYLFTLITIPRK